MQDLYRKSSMEKLSNPEQLDKAITVSSPMSWLALIGVALIILAAAVWSVKGTLPTIENAQGVIVSPIGAGAVYAEQSGTVKKIHVKVGDKISSETEIATVELSNGEEYTLKAGVTGTVSELCVLEDSGSEGTESMGQGKTADVYPGTEVIRYTPALGSDQAVVCFVPITSAQKYKNGMLVRVSLQSVDSQTYGNMKATVVSVGNYPVSQNSFRYVGAEASASQFQTNGSVAALLCELETDPSTVSGYLWSSKKGASLTVPNGTYVTAKIIIEETHPITKVIAKLKDVMEG